MKSRFILAIIVVILAGCKPPGLERAVITGKVTYQDEPVQRGQLRFVPIEGTQGPPAGATIEAGSYTVKALGGVPVGTARVKIKAYHDIDMPGGPPTPAATMGVRPGKQYLPDKYNKQSELNVTIAAGEQTLDFELE